MPVRIYDLAKKLGLDSKSVLAKAKDLGIATAKVPSSSLDKITAEYLEEQLRPMAKAEASTAPAPEPIAQAPVAPPIIEPPVPVAAAPAPLPTPEISAPLASPSPEKESRIVAEPAAPPVVVAAPIPPIAPPPEPIREIAATAPPAPLEAKPVAPPAAPVPPPPPAPPAGPQVGEKIGFIQLPQKAAPKAGEKVGSVNLPPRPGQQPPPPGRTAGGFQRPGQPQGFQQRGPQQGFQRGGQQGFQRGPGQFQQNRGPQQGGFQRGGPQGGRDQARPAGPAPDRFVAPTTGEMITMKPPIVVRDLAERLQKKPFQLISDLMALSVFANVNQAIDELVAQKICAKYGFRFEVEKRERGGGQVNAPVRKTEPDIVEDKPEDLKPRPPVVTIMGRVDHGKTTLLDVIRKADVASGEAGGITQHIGAYTILIPHPERPTDLQQITFLDTPGHAAFSAMRARGAHVTDIVILVVAANDGVMPQTLEALSHAKEAKVPIIVAVNKIDHPNANPAKVRQQLQEKEIVPEEWGGETIFQDVSALTKLNIDKLLELIVLQAEVMELKANPDRTAKGNVIESGLEPGGPTATVLVRKGTLRVGDVLLCGPYYGKVRALINEEGKRLKEAGPSVAVKMLGLNGVPEAGVEFTVIENEKTARNIAGERALALKSEEFEKRPKVTLENLFDTLASEQNKTLKVIVKADTQGSVEAIVDALKKIETDKVALDIIHSAVGTITESDVILASASEPGAIVLGFHTRIDNGVSDVAKREGVQIKLYAIIYELIDQVKEAMAGLLDPLTKEVVIGSAEVRKIFGLSKGGNVAGCVVSSGRIVKGKMRVMRRKGLIYEGVSLTLRRFQDEVNEVRAGMECGIRLDGFDDFQIGDAIECYTLEKVPQKL